MLDGMRNILGVILAIIIVIIAIRIILAVAGAVIGVAGNLIFAALVIAGLIWLIGAVRSRK